MDPSEALAVFFTVVGALFMAVFLVFLFGSEQAFEMTVVVLLIYFILGFVTYLRWYGKNIGTN